MSLFDYRGSAGSSAPGTLPEYLASIGKASWYGGFKAPHQLFSDIANTVPVVTDGAGWRNWLANWSAGGFNAYFTQSTGSRRPALGTNRNGLPGVYGDATDWRAGLDSTTALNRSYTLLMSCWSTMTGSSGVFSHNNNTHSFRTQSSVADPLVYANSTGGITVPKVIECTPVSGTTAKHRVGWSTVGTNHYNNAPSILCLSNNSILTDSTIYELWFTETLTTAEITQALKYLA